MTPARDHGVPICAVKGYRCPASCGQHFSRLFSYCEFRKVLGRRRIEASHRFGYDCRVGRQSMGCAPAARTVCTRTIIRFLLAHLINRQWAAPPDVQTINSSAMISSTSNHEAPGIKRGYDRSDDRKVLPGDVEFREAIKQHYECRMLIPGLPTFRMRTRPAHLRRRNTSRHVSAHRLERAKELLTLRNQSLLNIAFAPNFSSRANFTQALSLAHRHDPWPIPVQFQATLRAVRKDRSSLAPQNARLDSSASWMRLASRTRSRI